MYCARADLNQIKFTQKSTGYFDRYAIQKFTKSDLVPKKAGIYSLCGVMLCHQTGV